MRRTGLFASSLVAVLAFAQLAWAQLPAAPAGARAPVAGPIPTLTPPLPDDLRNAQPLLVRGLVMFTYWLDSSVENRVTHYVRIRAPIAVVRQAITRTQDWPSFMPIVREVQNVSTFRGRTGIRLRATASMFDVSVNALMHEVNDRRIDFTIAQSELGASTSRWELTEESPTTTLLAMTIWCDPSRGNWLMQQITAQSPFTFGGAGMVAGSVLVLAVRRRAEMLAGLRLPVRPATASVAPGTLDPPAPGPWLQTTLHSNMFIVSFDEQGAMRQITVAGHCPSAPDVLQRRMAAVERYPTVWNWLTGGNVLARPSANAARFRLGVGSPLASQSGELVRTVEGNGSRILLDGASGAFAGEQSRWDILPREGGSWVMYTGGTESRHLGFWHRMIHGLDPFTDAGLTGYWRLMTLLYGLRQMDDG